MTALEQAYRQKKNKQLWSLIGQYAQILAKREVRPTFAREILKEAFAGKPFSNLTASEETHFWKTCAERIIRAHVYKRFRSEHISALSAGQLQQLSEDVELLIQGQPLSKAPQYFRGDQPATVNQLNYVQRLFDQLDWTLEHQRNFIARILKGKQKVETRREASSLIQALLAVLGKT